MRHVIHAQWGEHPMAKSRSILDSTFHEGDRSMTPVPEVHRWLDQSLEVEDARATET
jgi:hypothetical protein